MCVKFPPLVMTKAKVRDLMTCRVLKPGGWVQMIEYYYMCQSDNGSITDSSPARQWSQKYMQSMEGLKEPRAGLRLQTLLVGAGFAEVDLEMIRVPLCAWLAGRDNPRILMLSRRPSGYCGASLTYHTRSSQAKTHRRTCPTQRKGDHEQPLHTPIHQNPQDAN